MAIVGRPNAGKSSYINRLLRAERVIVSDVAGTTRDSIDVPFTGVIKEAIRLCGLDIPTTALPPASAPDDATCGKLVDILVRAGVLNNG